MSEDDKKKALQGALYHLIAMEPFYGTMLQMMTIKYNDLVPTAGLLFDLKTKTFQIYINADFFLSKTTEERIAILHHEVLHFTNKHIFRFQLMKIDPSEQMLLNIAADMAINQYITGLPKDCIDVKDWKTDQGYPFPTFKDMETYYDLIKKNAKANQDKMQGEGEGKSGPGVIDKHTWAELPEEMKKELLEEAKNIIKRTMEKTSFSHSRIPDSIKDILQELEDETTKINAKQILRQTIKKTVSVTDRERTWNKPNKRYGVFCPGTKVGVLPKLEFYIDTSGSISIQEANMFLGIMNKFLKAGVRTTHLNLWHDKIYYSKKHRFQQPIERSDFESGGTNVESVLIDILKKSPNLSVVLTDGYFSNSHYKPKSEVIWIISDGGSANHPLMHIGKTILLKDLK